MNSLPKTVTRQRRDCDLNPGSSAPESSMLTARLPSHPDLQYISNSIFVFSKFNTRLCVRGSVLRLAITPEFFLLFLYARILCLHWLALTKYVCICM